ncbi:hypothetical protein [Glutamicibacter sp. NPDC087344]|uniref:hypothetical protein n=1 Tax=Glutamicibacter sp. NPDC087344 TaxID=3363994 RepID=UPI00381FCC6C
MAPNISRKPSRRTGILRKLGAACAVAALSFTGIGLSAVPSQAYSTSFDLFSVSTHIQGKGWITGPGTKSQGLRLEAIKVVQNKSDRICLRAHVSNVGWQGTKCTTGKGTSITVGTTGRSLAIEAVETWIPTRGLTVTAHIKNIGDQRVTRSTKGGHVTVGTTGRALQMEWFYIQPHAL